MCARTKGGEHASARGIVGGADGLLGARVDGVVSLDVAHHVDDLGGGPRGAVAVGEHQVPNRLVGHEDLQGGGVGLHCRRGGCRLRVAQACREGLCAGEGV